MSKRASEDVLGTLHEAVALTLLTKIQSGEATPAELNAAIKFLQNNGIEASVEENEPLKDLMASLPVFDDEGDDGYVN